LAQFAVLITFRDLCHREPKESDVREILSKYCRREVIAFLAKMNCLLKTWQNEPSFETDALLSQLLLKRFQRDIQTMRLLNSKRYVFSRLGLLYLIKQACLACPESGSPLNSENAHADIGLCCLMVNDLVLPFVPSPSDGTLEKLTNLLPFTDYVSRDQYPMEIARTHMMFEEIAQLPILREKGDFLDINSLFTKQFGLTIRDFCELIFACSTRFLNVTIEDVVSSPEALLMRGSYFDKTQLSAETVRRFLANISITAEELAARIRESQNRPGDDLTLFQQFPFLEILPAVYLCLDPGFLVDKAGRAAFWTLFHAMPDRSMRLRLATFWGAVFEEYVNDILAKSYRANGRMIPSPRFSNGDQAFDACFLEDTNLVVLEHKSSTLRADAKYGGDVGRLRKDLLMKFVQGDEDGAKGIEQLSRSLRRFLEGEAMEGITPAQVHKIYPALICLDSSTTVPYMGRYFNEEFQTRFSRRKARKIVTPVFTLGISDVENILGFLDSMRISDILESYYRADSRMFWPLSSSDIPLLRSAQPGTANWLRERFSHFARTMEKRFFGTSENPDGSTQ
jgi:hypothetical protein